VHGFPSSVHPVPLGFFWSAGQAPAVPVQLSATSHSPAAERQTLVDGRRMSAGHTGLTPVQFSAGSQMPVDGRQGTVEGAKASAGHAALEPVQFSATSQPPAAGRHVVVDATNLQFASQQSPAVPLLGPSSHCSAPSMAPLPQVSQ
jgi:hypothetical protein